MDVITNLNDWHERGIIDMKTSGVMHVYRIEKTFPRTTEELNGIADKLYEQMEQREQAELERTQHVVALATSSSCISRGLAKYFGDTSKSLPEECGHCTWCETHEPRKLGKQAYRETRRQDIEHVLKLIPERDDPRFLARVAFGITSPRITAAKLQNDKNVYESLPEHDFVVCLPHAFLRSLQVTLLIAGYAGSA
jgi:superfamily II DNA helicase RecQ